MGDLAADVGAALAADAGRPRFLPDAGTGEAALGEAAPAVVAAWGGAPRTWGVKKGRSTIKSAFEAALQPVTSQSSAPFGHQSVISQSPVTLGGQPHAFLQAVSH